VPLSVSCLTRKVIDEFRRNFWRDGLSVTSNKGFDFDPDHHLDPGILLTEFLPLRNRGNCIKVLRPTP